MVSDSITGVGRVVTGTSLTNAQPVHVAIVDGSGTQITSFGGGTQYTDAGVTPAHPTGTMPVYDNAGAIASVSITNRLPVSAAQSGTWNITNISGTISLPTGAATAAKQPALGTAGTASADVITIQGIASMTAVKVDGSAVTQPVSGTVGVSGSVAVTGTFWQSTQPVSIASAVTVAQATASSLNATVVGTGTFAVQA